MNDYAKYCVLSGQCQVSTIGKNDYPVTGVSLAEARAYAQWLSEQSGKRYRLPTRAEWRYAGYANGLVQEKANCLVGKSDEERNWARLDSSVFGRTNGWHLAGFIGNAQEWTTEPNGEVMVSGGHYLSESEEECNLDFLRPHSGSADEVTGFRLVREEIDN